MLALIGSFKNSVKLKKRNKTIMAGLLTVKNERNERSSTSENTNKNSMPNNITVFDLAVLILSVFSIFVDFCTDLVLVVQYSNQGYKSWAIATVLLIFFPSIVVQFFSLRWHIAENTVSALDWVLHIFMLGIVHRYIQVIKFGFIAFKSKNSSDIQKVFLDQNDLCLLHLFESFLESAPQLVLQLYVIAKVHEWRFWTGLSALASLLSLAWALAAYTKAQRRARENKNLATCPGLLFQAVWRTGMLTSRIAALVLAAYSFGNCIFLLITIHWIAMTIWITYQKTDFCETYWEEKIYNAVVGVIYCFCFFNLQEGQSRWRALAFYFIIVFQNLICLTIFLMWFSEKTPELALYGFIAIVGGIVFGSTGVLFYYRFFHPSGAIRFFSSPQPTGTENAPPFYSTLTLRSLKRMRREFQGDCHQKTTLQSDSVLDLNNKNTFSDSIVIVEENILDDSDADIKALQNWIDEPNCKGQTVSETNKSGKKETETNAYKRKAICTSAELVKLLEAQTKPKNWSLKLTTDETFSEILSVHDYENLCSVNISRETWGLRSWRGYPDIETGLHDDSVVYNRHLETLTSTSSSSSIILQKESESSEQEDNIDAMPDPAHCDSKVSLDYVLGRHLIDPLTTVPHLGTLEPIFEEIDEWNNSGIELSDLKARNGCASTLVATIEEIRMNTPIGSRCWVSDGIYDRFPLNDINPKLNRSRRKVTFPLKLLFPENKMESLAINETELSPKQTDDITAESIKQEITDIKAGEEVKSKRNEVNISIKKSINSDNNEASELKISGKENVDAFVSKINHWNKIINAQNEKYAPAKKEVILLKKDIVTKKDYFC